MIRLNQKVVAETILRRMEPVRPLSLRVGSRWEHEAHIREETMTHRCVTPAVAALFATVALPAFANDSVMEAVKDPANWAIQTGDYANTRYSTLDQINKDNVGDLQVAWSFSTGVLRGHEGSPLVIGNMMYVHTPFPNIVYALDLNEDGRIVWKYEPKQNPDVIAAMCCDTINRGVAYADGKIFLHQADTTVVALDAKTGEVKWTAVNGDPTKGETNTATVLPVKDKVIVGISGGEYGIRGHVTAYNIETGEQVWRAYSTGPDDEMLVDPEKTTALGKPIGAELVARQLGRRRLADRRRPDLGLVQLRSRSSTCSTTAPATPGPGTRCSVRATTSTR